MNLPSFIGVMIWLVRDTFRQGVSSRISWIMLGVSGVAILACLSVSVTGDEPELYEPAGFVRPQDIAHLPDVERVGAAPVVQGQLTLLFGTMSIPLGRTREHAVRFLEVFLGGRVAGNLGVLLALIWTAGFLPSFLEASSITVLLVRPVPRWLILAGKFLGVLIFLLAQAAVFVLGTWFALGVRTGVWEATYLLAIPLLLLHFAVFFSFSTFLAVWTRSTVTTVFGSIFLWVMCWAMNYSHHTLLAYELEQAKDVRKQVRAVTVLAAAPGAEAPGVLPWAALLVNCQAEAPREDISRSSTLREVGYWLLPKPGDIGILLANAIDANTYFAEMGEYRVLERNGVYYPTLAMLSSLAFGLLFLVLAGYEFVHIDY